MGNWFAPGAVYSPTSSLVAPAPAVVWWTMRAHHHPDRRFEPRSKYMPHQGDREKARRRRQLAAAGV